MNQMKEIQLFIINRINKLADEGLKRLQTKNQIITILCEIQKYLRMLRELERMKYLLTQDEDYKNGNVYNDELFIENRIDPEVAVLAKLLGYDEELEGKSTDDIWELTGH